jgi:hypothetical protein
MKVLGLIVLLGLSACGSDDKAAYDKGYAAGQDNVFGQCGVTGFAKFEENIDSPWTANLKKKYWYYMNCTITDSKSE